MENNNNGKVPGKGIGIASLVLGILALVLVIFIPYGGIMGLVCSIIGIIFGSIARKEMPQNEVGIATAGFVCSIVALGICGIVVMSFLACVGSLGASGLFDSF